MAGLSTTDSSTAPLSLRDGVSYNPKRQASLVWAVPVSLATTQEIAFAFSSSGYLDVSVPQVCLPYPMYSDMDTARSGQWVSPFGNLRIKAYLQLPEAYRCSSRPSSAPSAKASTVRPS